MFDKQWRCEVRKAGESLSSRKGWIGVWSPLAVDTLMTVRSWGNVQKAEIEATAESVKVWPGALDEAVATTLRSWDGVFVVYQTTTSAWYDFEIYSHSLQLRKVTNHHELGNCATFCNKNRPATINTGLESDPATLLFDNSIEKTLNFYSFPVWTRNTTAVNQM